MVIYSQVSSPQNTAKNAARNLLNLLFSLASSTQIGMIRYRDHAFMLQGQAKSRNDWVWGSEIKLIARLRHKRPRAFKAIKRSDLSPLLSSGARMTITFTETKWRLQWKQEPVDRVVSN